VDYANASVPAAISVEAPTAPVRARPIAAQQTRCSSCNVRNFCLPGGMNARQIQQFDALVGMRRQVKAGDSLYEAGTPFNSLYAVRSGSFKSQAIRGDGTDQVTGFQMSGEIIGLDGIYHHRQTLSVVALEHSEVCVIPYAQLADLCETTPAMHHQVHRIMSREIIHQHEAMMQLSSFRAEQRVAAFLLRLSQRYLARGYAASRFHMRMSREDIGSYLGLTLETVSRAFSRFHRHGILSVQNRFICILNVEHLKRLLGGTTEEPSWSAKSASENGGAASISAHRAESTLALSPIDVPVKLSSQETPCTL
jgi:CRP/FNR family transcriptional regulator, anaerobic regulatory protein